MPKSSVRSRRSISLAQIGAPFVPWDGANFTMQTNFTGTSAAVASLALPQFEAHIGAPIKIALLALAPGDILAIRLGCIFDNQDGSDHIAILGVDLGGSSFLNLISGNVQSGGPGTMLIDVVTRIANDGTFSHTIAWKWKDGTTPSTTSFGPFPDLDGENPATLQPYIDTEMPDSTATLIVAAATRIRAGIAA
jgi:hypothetical protein